MLAVLMRDNGKQVPISDKTGFSDAEARRAVVAEPLKKMRFKNLSWRKTGKVGE
jgi:hypothetical protein